MWFGGKYSDSRPTSERRVFEWRVMFLYHYKCAAPERNDISDLDLNRIQSIEVLKDASATAVYGSRGVE